MNRDADYEQCPVIFNAAIGLVGICITVVALFDITDKRAEIWVDECFSVAIALYLAALLCAYAAMRTRKERIIKTAYGTFQAGLMVMVISGIFLIAEL